MLLVFKAAGLFPTETAVGDTVYTEYPSWVVVCSGIVGVIAGIIASSVWMRVRYGANEGITAEAQQNFVTYRYTVTDGGIKVSHGGQTDELSFGDIEKITSNGFAYYVYAGGRKYQIGRNGFGGKETEFYQFIRSKGFAIGVEA